MFAYHGLLCLQTLRRKRNQKRLLPLRRQKNRFPQKLKKLQKRVKNLHEESKRIREEISPQLTVVWDTVFSPGMRVKLCSYGRMNVLAHVVEINNGDPTLRFGIIKGQSYISGLERLGDMMYRLDTTQSDSVLCAINANFWSAYRNVPIGPLVIEGEVAQ